MRVDPVAITEKSRTIIKDATSRDPSVATLGKPSLAVVALIVSGFAIELLADIATSLRPLEPTKDNVSSARAAKGVDRK